MDSDKKDMLHALSDKIKNHAAHSGAAASDTDNSRAFPTTPADGAAASDADTSRAFSTPADSAAASDSVDSGTEGGRRTSGAKPVAVGESRRRRN